MGPALQVHTPPKKQRGAPCGAPRVFRPCVAQTEEGYIRRFYKREPRGIPPKGRKGANLPGNDIPRVFLLPHYILSTKICKHGFSHSHIKAIKRHKANLCLLIAPPPEGGGGGNRVLLNNHGCAALLCGVSRTDIARECVNGHVCKGSAVENCGCGIALKEKPPCCSVKGSAIHRHCSTVGNCFERI